MYGSDIEDGALKRLSILHVSKAPDGSDQWSRGLDRSKLKLYKWSTVRPNSGLVRTMNQWSEPLVLLVQSLFKGFHSAIVLQAYISSSVRFPVETIISDTPLS